MVKTVLMLWAVVAAWAFPVALVLWIVAIINQDGHKAILGLEWFGVGVFLMLLCIFCAGIYGERDKDGNRIQSKP